VGDIAMGHRRSGGKEGGGMLLDVGEDGGTLRKKNKRTESRPSGREGGGGRWEPIWGTTQENKPRGRKRWPTIRPMSLTGKGKGKGPKRKQEAFLFRLIEKSEDKRKMLQRLRGKKNK